MREREFFSFGAEEKREIKVLLLLLRLGPLLPSQWVEEVYVLHVVIWAAYSALILLASGGEERSLCVGMRNEMHKGPPGILIPRFFSFTLAF